MAQQPAINPTPKARFQQSGDSIAKHRNMVDLPEFTRATDFALLEYQMLLAKQTQDTQTAMAAGLKLQGALEFLTQLRLLSETAKVPTPQIVEQLNHRV